MKACLTGLILAGILAVQVAGGLPATSTLQLRKIELLACASLTPENLPEVSEHVRTLPDGPESRAAVDLILEETPGYVIVARALDQRDIEFDNLSGEDDAVGDTGWSGQASDSSKRFVYSSSSPKMCSRLTPGNLWTVILDDKSDCDTDPPEGICVFDHPIRDVDDYVRKQYLSPGDQ